MDQKHNFLRAKASRDILKFRVSEMTFPGVFKRYFQLRMLCCSLRILAMFTGNNAIETSQAFHNIVQFKHFTDLNLFKYVFSVIQNWNTDALQFYSMVHMFC